MLKPDEGLPTDRPSGGLDDSGRTMGFTSKVVSRSLFLHVRSHNSAADGTSVLTTPAYLGTFLAASWAQGKTKVRHLFSDIRRRGYKGSFSHLARFVAPWRRTSPMRTGVTQHSSDELHSRRRVCECWIQ